MKNENPVPSPEAKAATGGSDEVAIAFDEFMRAFEAYREANDERLSQIESQISPDVVTVEKMDRIDRALDEQKRLMDSLVLRGKRPSIEGQASLSAFPSERKQAFEAYVRRGDETGLRRLEAKDLSAGTDSEGGYLAPSETAQAIAGRMAEISPIRSISQVIQISSSSYKQPRASTDAAASWVGETDDRDKTDSPSFEEIEFQPRELYAMPAASNVLLEDSAIDVDSWLASQIETVFAEKEGEAFVNGTGDKKPSGFLKYATASDGARSGSKLGYLATGAAGRFKSSNPSDTLVEAIYALKSGYRGNAHWVMNRKIQSEIRKFKDGDGNYLWRAPASPGSPAMLMGFPLIEAEDMPDAATNSLSIAFGDFRRGYLIVDRAGIRVLRDPYSSKPYVLFYVTKRVGGGVQDFEAIKLIKFATS